MESHPTALPPRDEMLAALMERDASCDGLFLAAITTTGIFCRPSCPARKPRPEHVEFYPTARAALLAGFRPCLRCRPLEDRGRTPEWVSRLLARVEARPDERIRDGDLRAMGLDPVQVRRHFLQTFGLTFQAYSRARRLGKAYAALRSGRTIDDAVFDHGWESHSGFRAAFAKLVGAAPGRSASARDDHVRLAWLDTPLGPMLAGATSAAVCLLEFTDRREVEAQLAAVRDRLGLPLVPGESEILDKLRAQLAEYFAGSRRAFELPLHAPGSAFQQRVWDGLLRIPYGQTRSYAELARELGQPGAARAVGHANGQNRIAIVIPCHRVIAAGGGLGGYGGGLWRKLRLLETEGVAVSP
ncbi:MAG TPA: methylated-DNA--[protein]-cysteine S-methyltransferase [Myxococcota bacterium]|nr:methylated-DNA--[protein]-cysteine S-methyltransferase [Myxococcota bacterium]HRY95837.1 methylated-DNA--[protein]-cysteine S-methyltransferase [Myxococcota bacterium]HSA22803.1 methylated-DNA--[protein]-cysteine S-methyltransferase [Myxococcota bacterium]